MSEPKVLEEKIGNRNKSFILNRRCAEAVFGLINREVLLSGKQGKSTLDTRGN